MDKKLNCDWLVEELQIQLSICEMTGDRRKVSDLERAIEILGKNLNVFYFPEVMNFKNIDRPPVIPSPPVTINSSTHPALIFGTFGSSSNYSPVINTPGAIPSPCPPMAIPALPNYNYGVGPPGVVPITSSTPVQVVPAPYPTSPCPVMAYPIYNYNEPNVGDKIFGIFRDENGDTRMCLYTWQEKDNPEEITAYAAGYDENYSSVGRRYTPCKKYPNEKFLVICANECCNQE